MSAPHHIPAAEFVQPEFASTAPTGVEPTNEQLDEPEDYRRTSRIVAFSLVVSAISILISIWTIMDTVSSMFTPDYPPPVTQTSSLCEPGQVEVTTVEGDSSCVARVTYNELVDEAEAQYAASLKRGKPVYTKWLVAHKLDKVKTESRREEAAKKYICQIEPNFGDGALYAATKTGKSEGKLEIAIGDLLVPIDGYDPSRLYCSDGKPVPPPNPPRLQPKDPYADPAANGNAGDAGGPNAPRPEPSRGPR